MALRSSQLKIVLIPLLVSGALMALLFVSIVFWPVADVEQGSDLIICLGGNPHSRQKKSLTLYNKKHAQKLLLINQSPRYFLKNGVLSSNIYTTDSPFNTFSEARFCRKFMEKNKLGSALVVSDWWHLRRVRWSFETVFKGAGIDIRYISTRPEAFETGYDLTPYRIKLILEEMVKLAGYWVKY
jgi:uncharacterized SAM-binding protein YcdF (DUF218 family)